MANRTKPREVKVAQGTFRPGREQRNAPERVSGVPKMPRTLRGAERECWLRVSALLARRGQLGMDSVPALLALCETYAEREALRAHLEQRGRFQRVKTTAGDTIEKAHPAVALLADADRRYRAWLVEFGLTDASRGKVSATPPGDDADDVLATYGLN